MFSTRQTRQTRRTNNNLGNIELINRNYLRNEYKGLMTRKQYNYFIELNKIKPLRLAIGAGDTINGYNEKKICDIKLRSLDDFDMFLYFSEDNDSVKICKKYLQNKEDELGNTREYQIVKVDLNNKEYVNFIFGTFKFIHIEGIDNTFAFINENNELLYNILNSLVNEGTFTNSDIFGFTINSNLYNLNKKNINKEKNNFIRTIREKIGNNFIQNIIKIKRPHEIIEPQIIFDIIILPLFELNIIKELENNFRTFINNNNNKYYQPSNESRFLYFEGSLLKKLFRCIDFIKNPNKNNTNKFNEYFLVRTSSFILSIYSFIKYFSEKSFEKKIYIKRDRFNYNLLRGDFIFTIQE
jgi:hypothetical protein